MAATMISLTCERCGAQFVLPLKRAGQRYCSRTCAVTASHARHGVAERFWRYVEKTKNGCWLWRGYLNKGGYGIFSAQDRTVRAHRFSWELANGPIPEGLVICHDCDRKYAPGSREYRRCVNPEHLFLGTLADNNKDAVSKGRSAKGERSSARLRPETRPRGERHPDARITDAIVRELRAQHVLGALNQSEAARRLGVSTQAINEAIHRKTWKHVH